MENNNNENASCNAKKGLFAKNLKDSAKTALAWAKETGETAKEKAGEAKAWVDEKTPEVMEKLSDAAEKAKETAGDAAEWADASAKKTKAWIEAQNVANQQRKMSYELATLKPIFDDNIPDSFAEYPVINILKSDEKRSKSPVCAGSYGFMSDTKELVVPNIYVASFDKFEITLTDKLEEGVYYANPYIPGEYIEANQYAKYLKAERVRELVQVAEVLGAKYVSVSFDIKERKVEEVSGKLSAKQKKNLLEFEAEQKLINSLELKIGKDRHMSGHNNPSRPQLVYYKYDKDILDLIESRINGTNPVNRETYRVSYATASQAKQKEALKIDAALKILNLHVKHQLSTCYAVEEAIKMNYTIEF